MSAPNWSSVTVPLSALKPWEHNPRTMTQAEAKRLIKSRNKLGQFQTIAIGPDGEVYDGHQRLNAWLTVYGKDSPIDARQSDRPLTEAERRELTINANEPAGAWGDEFWTWPELPEWGFDQERLDRWNSDGANLSELLASAASESLTERNEQLEARQYLRVLISVPLDEAIEAREIIEQIASIDGAQIDYGAN